MKGLFYRLLKMSRANKQLFLMFIDSASLVFVLIVSFSIRFGYLYLPNNEILWIIIGSPIIAIPIFMRFGLYNLILRFISFRSIWSAVQATTLYAIIWGLLILMFSISGVPRSVILLNWSLSIISIVGIRMFGRWILAVVNNFDNILGSKNVLVYGAGAAGRQLSVGLSQSNEYNPIAFIDDNKDIYHHLISDLRVFSRNDLNELIVKHNISEVLIAIPAISVRKRNEIVNFLEPFKVSVKLLPGLSEIADGRVKVSDLSEINYRELLGRKPALPNKNLLSIMITDMVVLVSGAGGSIGSELCRQIVLLKPKALILFEQNEFALYQIDQELNSKKNILDVKIIPVLGSIQDLKKMKDIFTFYEVKTIYHAAAYKHVPLVEHNQTQGVLNNTIGTKKAAEAAIYANVKTFVLISTDKAVRPTNTMGATKRVAELTLQALAKKSKTTCFTMVRFGNVIDSSGSVIPLFKKQIQNGGPVTVTDKNVVRFFMTIPEAVELVIQAGAMSKGGDVFVLDMGKPIKIFDLAKKMINLSGLSIRNKHNLNGDIEIIFTGLRAGEKLYEELLVGDDSEETENKLILRANEEMISWEILSPLLISLEEASINNDAEKVSELLIKLVPGFKPSFY
jgi:FlaA1/EpsC-like NDP-sugar epimerase